MPWCAKCVAEYSEGVRNCPECGSELVGELPGFTNAISPQQREWLSSVARSFAAALLAIGALIGLFAVAWWLPNYGFFWEMWFLGSAPAICAATGFVSGRLRRGSTGASSITIGWLVPWTAPCMVAVNSRSYGSVGPAGYVLVHVAWAITCILAGVFGTMMGSQWRRHQDWLRLATFCMLLLALSYFWSVTFDLALVARD